MTNKDKVDFEVASNKKSTSDRWNDYEANREAAGQSIPQVIAQRNSATDTITSASGSDRNTSSSNSDTAKKASAETSRFFSMDTLSRIWNLFSNLLTAPVEESKDQAMNVSKTGTTPITGPVLSPPENINEIKLKEALNELFDLLTALNQRKEESIDERDESKKDYQADLFLYLIVQAMIAQRESYELSSKNHIAATNRYRVEGKEHHSKLIEIDTVSLDLKQSQQTWDTINSGLSTTNTAMTVAALAGYLLVNLGPAALTGGFTIPASLVATLTSLAARTAVVTGVASAAGNAYKAHLDYKQNLSQSDITTLRSKYDITNIKMRDFINRVVGDYERSLELGREMKNLLDSYSESMQLISARR